MKYIDKKQTVKLISYMSTFDGGIYRRNSGEASFIMNMVKENIDYLEWVKASLEEFTSVRLKDRPDYNTDGYTRKPQMRLESRQHPFLTKIHNRVYIDRKKVIDPHMLTLMDEEALAIIFMCDGGSYLDTRFKNPSGRINLHTKGFSYGDNWLLKKSIKEKLDLEFNVHRHNQYYYLYLRTKDINSFVRKTLPYIKDSFLYKIERITPILDDDIVCTLRKRSELIRNELASSKEEVTK